MRKHHFPLLMKPWASPVLSLAGPLGPTRKDPSWRSCARRAHERCPRPYEARPICCCSQDLPLWSQRPCSQALDHFCIKLVSSVDVSVGTSRSCSDPCLRPFLSCLGSLPPSVPLILLPPDWLSFLRRPKKVYLSSSHRKSCLRIPA